jgi:diguanylate cyclase (GGDEF)-like protein
MLDTKFFETMLDGIACCKLVANQSAARIDYQYLMVNSSFTALSGLEQTELIGKTVNEVTPELAPLCQAEIFTTETAHHSGRVQREHYFSRTGRWCLVNAYTPENGYLVVALLDVTPYCKKQLDLAKQNRILQKRNERMQKKLAQQFRLADRNPATEFDGFLEKSELREEICSLLCKASNDGLWYWDIRTDQLLLIGSWYQHLNLADFEPNTKMRQWIDRIYPADLPEVQRAFVNYLDGDIGQCRCRYRVQTGAAKSHWVEVTAKALFNADGKPYVMAGAHIDIDQTQSQQELQGHLGGYDSLTGLPNRLMFFNCLCKAVKVARQHHCKSVVVFLNLEQSNKINEVYGFELEDHLVTKVAVRLKELIRNDEESIARLGKDEFAFILHGIHEISEIIGFCERLRLVFDEPFKVKKRKVKLCITIGVAIYPEDCLEPEDLLYNAFTAFDSMKGFTNDNWQFYRPVLEEDVTRKNEIRKRLHMAIDQRRFDLHYQPQIEMKTGKIRAVEALLRWNEPGLGWVSPLEFIPFAEESGLIVPLGEWVLREACRQNVLWQKQFGIEILMAVNISVVQLRQACFAKMVKALLAETGMQPQLLELEVTESVLIHSFEKVVNMLGELRQIGVRISLDDFGAGYSWLSYLKRLPLDTLKLDKSIINDIHYNMRGKSITKAIVEMVRKLGLKIVAEGVEHQKQFDFLRSSKCDYVQGYLIGHPLCAEGILKAGILNGIDEINRR